MSRRPSRLASPVVGLVLAGTLLSLGLSACGDDDTATGAAQSGSAPSELRIAYQLVPNGDLIVKNKKWLEEALPDTDITWTKFESGGDVNTAIVAGSIDIGLVGSSPATRGLAAPLNIPYQVTWIHDVIGDAESLVASTKSGVTDVAGLKGKKVGTPFASTAHYSLEAALKKAGLSTADVTLVDLQPPDLLAAWQRGDIDAAYVWDPTLTEIKKDGVVLTTSSQVAADGNPTYDLAVVTKDFATKYPDALKSWLLQEDRAVELLTTDQPAGAEAIGTELNLSAEEVTAQLDGLSFVRGAKQVSAEYFGTPAEPGGFAASLEHAAEFLKGQEAIDAVPQLSALQAGIAVQPLDAAFGGK
jgi:taurine transport system substrate-binding protein